MVVNIKSSQKVAEIFSCINCNYNTCKKSNYNKHLLTNKHKKLINVNKSSQKVADNNSVCENCNKIFKSYVGLWKHNKKCITKNKSNDEFELLEQTNNKTPSLLDKDEMIMMLLKQNTELMEILKNGTNNTNITNTNSNNKAFNLNFFLNETCKCYEYK
jgi:aromatic ring hydroxylase